MELFTRAKNCIYQVSPYQYANPKPLFVGEGPARGYQNINQPKLQCHGNHQGELIKAPSLSALTHIT